MWDIFNFSQIRCFKFFSFMIYLVRPAHGVKSVLLFFLLLLLLFLNSFSLFVNQQSYLKIFCNENSMHSVAMKAKPLGDLDSPSKANLKESKDAWSQTE